MSPAEADAAEEDEADQQSEADDGTDDDTSYRAAR